MCAVPSCDLMIGAGLLLGLLLLPLFLPRFPRWFYLYAFAFVPLYNVFLDVFVMRTGVQDIPLSLSLVKDVAWLYVLLCFAVWVGVRHQVARIPKVLLATFALFVGYLAIQAIRGYAQFGALVESLAVRNTLGYIPAFLVPLYLIRSQEDIARVLRYFAYVACGAALYAVPELLGLFHGRYYEMTQRPELLKSVASFFSDYNIYAYFSGITFALAAAGSRELLTRRPLMLVAMAASFGGVLVSQSRGGLAAFFAALVLLAIFRLLNGRALFGMGIVLALILVLAPHDILEHRIVGSIAFGTPYDIRMLAWPVLLEQFAQRPLWGYGLGTYGFARLRIEAQTGVTDQFLGVDNFYLALALNTGMIGVALFLGFMLLIVALSYRLIRTRGTARGMRSMVIGVDAALAVLLLSGMFTNLLESFPISLYFWFLAGMIVSVWNLQRGDEAPRRSRRVRTESRILRCSPAAHGSGGPPRQPGPPAPVD